MLTVNITPPFHYKSERYIIENNDGIGGNLWREEGELMVSLFENGDDPMGGPAMLMYNNKVIYFGADGSTGQGKTAIYSMPMLPEHSGSWVEGPEIPNVPVTGGRVIVSRKCPATLLPNGKVLFAGADYSEQELIPPFCFFEYDPSDGTIGTITQVPTPTNFDHYVVWRSRMMLLPTGDVLFSPSSNNVQLYVHDGGPRDAWRPTISTVRQIGGRHYQNRYLLVGTQLNGLSQANMFGNDCYCSTNYPIIRLQAYGTNHVYFARSFDFSTMGVATGASLVNCKFDTTGIPDGGYSLTVIANGIPSLVYAFQNGPPKNDLSDINSEIIKLVSENEIFHKKQEIEYKEIGEIKTQIADLKNSVNKLYSLLVAEKLPAVSADIADKASKNKKNRTTETAEKG